MYFLNGSVNYYLFRMKIEPLDFHWMMQKYVKKE